MQKLKMVEISVSAFRLVVVHRICFHNSVFAFRSVRENQCSVDDVDLNGARTRDMGCFFFFGGRGGIGLPDPILVMVIYDDLPCQRFTLANFLGGKEELWVELEFI